MSNSLDWTTDSDSPPVALPSEIPTRLDVSNLPLPILRSGSVEALIAQNEDLMARLSVTLRRMSIMEEDANRLKTEKDLAEQQTRNVADQILLHENKDEYWK